MPPLTNARMDAICARHATGQVTGLNVDLLLEEVHRLRDAEARIRRDAAREMRKRISEAIYDSGMPGNAVYRALEAIEGVEA